MSRRDKRSISPKYVLGIIGGIVAAVVAVNGFFALQRGEEERYVNELQDITNRFASLTQSYDSYFTLYKKGEISKEEILSITDTHLKDMKNLLARLENMNAPEKFREGHELYINSFEYEIQSNEHMRKYIETGDQSEYDKSTDMIQRAFDYELKALTAFKAANPNLKLIDE